MPKGQALLLGCGRALAYSVHANSASISLDSDAPPPPPPPASRPSLPGHTPDYDRPSSLCTNSLQTGPSYYL